MTGIYTSAEGARAIELSYRRFLGRWPVPSEQLRVPTRQGETFVVACGPVDAPPLLLLHGSMANATAWMGDVESWSAHFRVYAIDMIGEPGLSAPSRPDLASEAYAMWLDDVLRCLSVERASIVGVSLGGWLALDYATRRPGRVERLALLCPGGVGRQKYGVLLLAALLPLLGDRGRRAAMEMVLGVTPPDTPEAREFAEFMVLITRNFRPRRDTLPVFDDQALGRLDMPVLAIVGGRDRLLDSRRTGRRLRSAAPRARVLLLPDAGHLLLGQTRTILDFLRAPE